MGVFAGDIAECARCLLVRLSILHLAAQGGCVFTALRLGVPANSVLLFIHCCRVLDGGIVLAAKRGRKTFWSYIARELVF